MTDKRCEVCQEKKNSCCMRGDKMLCQECAELIDKTFVEVLDEQAKTKGE